MFDYGMSAFYSVVPGLRYLTSNCQFQQIINFKYKFSLKGKISGTIENQNVS